MTVQIPEMITPEQLAEQTGWSARRLRELARNIGACRIVGNRMLLTKDDIDALFEASKPKPRTALQSAGTPNLGGYEALKRFREKQSKKP